MEARPPVEQPYRTTTETALERALHEGSRLPALRGSGIRWWHVFVVLIVLVSPILQALAWVAFLFWLPKRARARARMLQGFAAQLAAYPLAVGPHVAWIRHGYFAPGPLDLVLRERHPLAEAAVRLAEPEAVTAWRDAATLRVSPRWGHDAGDNPRFDRLIDLLATHRDELGLERIDLVPP